MGLETEAEQQATDLVALSRMSLFGRVDLERFGNLLAACPVRELLPGELLFVKGQMNDRMYIVLKGRLAIHLDEGDEVYALLDRGDTVGEMSIVGEQATSAYVKADTATVLLEIPGHILWQIISKDTEFTKNLFQIFAKRLMSISSAYTFAQKGDHDSHSSKNVDNLTDLYSRYWLDENLPYEMARCQLRNRALSLLMIEVDYFDEYKQQNEQAAGDQVIRTLANTLLIGLRGLDMAVRFSDSVMMVILPGSGVNEAERVASRIHQAVENMVIKDQERQPLPSITLSIGVAGMIDDNDQAEMLIARTEAALQRARQSGGNNASS